MIQEGQDADHLCHQDLLDKMFSSISIEYIRYELTGALCINKYR